MTTQAVFNREVIMYKVRARRALARVSGACTRRPRRHCQPSHRRPRAARRPPQVDALRGSAEQALELLADAVVAPLLTEDEVAGARRVIAFQRDDAQAQPQLLVSENLYAAAYGGGAPYGRPEKCPAALVDSVTPATLRRFMGRYFTAPRVVLSGVGASPAALLNSAASPRSAIGLGRHPARTVGKRVASLSARRH